MMPGSITAMMANEVLNEWRLDDWSPQNYKVGGKSGAQSTKRRYPVNDCTVTSFHFSDVFWRLLFLEDYMEKELLALSEIVRTMQPIR
ncbi:hypothetical protein BELL_0283g00130 [Botrytis elliptica]|uniref:Uncharacterized protein n=1 Tax=Botrytis elliptica TaxID=278938 RepID=A0A4Z1JZQ7_9HELO|nr:hypothetical protein BELL_0283g00130 [Botrytis elliptica]